MTPNHRNLIFFKLAFLFAVTTVSAQTHRARECDTTILSKDEIRWCSLDSVYNSSIPALTKFYVSLKSSILPKYRLVRRKLSLSDSLKQQVLSAKKVYDSVFSAKFMRWIYDMDRNQKFVAPRAFMASEMAMLYYKFYPDVNAILLNDIHLNLNPKTSWHDQDSFKLMVDRIYQSIPHPMLSEIAKIVAERRKEIELAGLPLIPFSQSLATDEQKTKFDIVNFLIWME
jgi:hypothetical protein